jgi:hypothetical protein
MGALEKQVKRVKVKKKKQLEYSSICLNDIEPGSPCSLTTEIAAQS